MTVFSGERNGNSEPDLCKPDMFDPLAIVKLGDRAQPASADRMRDAVMNAASYQALCFRPKCKPSVKGLALPEIAGGKK